MTLAAIVAALWGVLLFQSMPLGGIPVKTTKAAPAVQHHSRTNSSVCTNGSTTCTITSSVVGTTGNTVYTSYNGCFNNACSTVTGCAYSVSDGTNTYTQSTAGTWTTTNQTIAVFFANNATAGTYTITWTITGTGCTFQFSVLFFMDISGVNTTTPQDTVIPNTGSNTSSVTTFTLTSAGNVASVNELIIVAITCGGGCTTISSSNFTLVDTGSTADFTLASPTSGATVTFNGTNSPAGTWGGSMVGVRAN